MEDKTTERHKSDDPSINHPSAHPESLHNTHKTEQISYTDEVKLEATNYNSENSSNECTVSSLTNSSSTVSGALEEKVAGKSPASTHEKPSKKAKTERSKGKMDNIDLNNILALAAESISGHNKASPTSSSSSPISTNYTQPQPVFTNKTTCMPSLQPSLQLPHSSIVTSTTSSTSIAPANFVLTQPHFGAGPAAQPQFFIAGPSQTTGTGLPYQQILIPLNQSQLINPAVSNGGQIAQQYITIPVSLNMGAQPIQILANPPILTAANIPGLQPLTMLPGLSTQDQGNIDSKSAAGSNPASSQPNSIMSPILISAGGHTILSAPQIPHQSLQLQLSGSNHQNQSQHLNLQQQLVNMQAQQEHNIITSLSNDLTSQIARFLPSIQSLTTSASTANGDHLAISTSDVLPTSNHESESPGVNEMLVSSTEPGCIVDGILLDDIKEFARQFKSRRLAMGLTQTQVGHALSAAEGPAYSQSAICRFEKLDITPKSAIKIKPVLERWLAEAEAKHRLGGNNINETAAVERTKKRKRRTSFTPQTVEVLSEYFIKNTHPSGSEMTAIANKLGYDREVVRVWFCNKRQAVKHAAKRFKPDTSTTPDG